MEILDFSSYLRILEQTEANPAPAQGADDTKLSTGTTGVINQIGILFFQIYARLLSIAKDYKDAPIDINNIVSAGADKKTEEMKKAISKSAAAMREEFKKEGLEKMWVDAGNKTTDSFQALVDQYKEDKQISDDLNTYFNKRMTGHLNWLKKSKLSVKEAYYSDGEMLFEGWFTTRKGNAKNMLKQAVALDANLEASVSDPALKTAAEKFKTEVKQIKDRLADLSVAKKKDIKEEELDKLQKRLDEIPQEFNAEQEKISKANTSNKEASTIFVEALSLANQALEKEEEAKEKLSKEADLKKGEEDKKKNEEFEKVRVKISDDVDPQKTQVSKTNRDVQKFQGLVLDVFDKVTGVADTELFKKFDKFGADGKFGGTTQGMVVALKAGFGLKDDTRKITQELMDEITKYAEEKKIKVMEPKKVEKIGDSLIHNFSSYNRMVELNSFIFEDFDVEKFKIAAKGGTPGPVKEPTKKEISETKPLPGAPKAEDSVEDVPSKVEDAVEKEAESETTKKLKEKLLSLPGVYEVKKGSDGAIAYTSAMRFYPGGKYGEVGTQKYGTFVPEDIIEKGLDAIVTDAKGNKKVLKWEMDNPLGSIHSIYTELSNDINGIDPRNKNLYCEVLPGLSTKELELIAHYYKNIHKRGLLQDLDDEWSNTKEIREFTRKFGDVLQKYN